MMTTNRSVWQATATIPEYDAIDRDQHSDVLVVGGGVIGLTTALYLQQEGTDVVLLEARRIGARTSGNTTGKVTSQHGAIYANLLDQHGLKVRLQVDDPEGVRYYLACPAGRGPVELEWDFISLLDTLRDQTRPGAPTPELAALQSLLLAVNELGKGFVQIGPLVIVRAPDALLYGVLSVSESRCFDTDRLIGDIPAAAARLQALPENRFGDLTAWPLRIQAA